MGIKRKAKKLKITSLSGEFYLLLKNEEIVGREKEIKNFNITFENFDADEYYLITDTGSKVFSKKVRNSVVGFREANNRIRKHPYYKIHVGKTILTKKTKYFYKVIMVINCLNATLV